MQSKPPANHPPVTGPRSRPRVALCEPDALLRALLAEWLDQAGFEPVLCAAAAAARDVALVVADVAAPRRDGAAAIAALRQGFPQARVLAISAQFIAGRHGVTAAAGALGADAVLAKPFAARDFIGVVQALVAS
jgi:DNA-binding response OmpR family regulator